MPNKIVKKRVYSNALDVERPVSPVSVQSEFGIEDKPGCCDVGKQMGKTAASRGPLFWGCLCFFLLILILGLIALIMFLIYYVGMPQMTILNVLLPDTSNSNDIQQNNRINLDLGGETKNPSLSFMINVNIKISNPNKLDLAFDRIDVSAFHPRVPDVQIGTSVLENVVLPKQGDLFLLVPVQVNYFFNDDPMGLLPTDLVESCAIKPGQEKPSKKMQLKLNLDAKLRVTSIIKIKLPTIQSSPSFDCPKSFSNNFRYAGKDYDLLNLNFSSIAKGAFAENGPISVNKVPV